jgi:excisionase family DNA binding protein
MPDDDLTVPQVAKMLDIDSSNVLRAIKRGRIDARRVGGKLWLVSPAALEVYIRTRPAGEKRGRKKASASPSIHDG